ncbi:penicillin-binding transpeptidase domain-containing protein [Geobacter sp. DSM 9736]|uniref:penicillin-binding transpeptidase domain-containing protein n=1 Tax=Geobacter sp. DSM 9736 TaxID=1277350 RepID=UPI000B509673|nr:penicillin-binding transpeptidase domain-containing protein [Geobacter sp. DSM 9736]SNB48035.1 Penicillin binding protein transpeptidase domain-containing protein [Geobacter sp. DSM 9736]
MRDIKHIIDKKGLFHRSPQRNSSVAGFKNLIESKPKKARLRIILPIVAVLLAGYPVASGLLNTISSLSKTATAAPAKAIDSKELFRLGAEALPSSRFDGGQLLATLPGGGTILYDIDQELQERVTETLRRYKVPYGAFVAMEPKTGKVIAMTGHSSVDPAWEAQSVYGLYPMASLFKIVTATAAIEQNKVTSDTVFAFRGRLTSENPKIWDVKPGRNHLEMPLAIAMGKSVNPVFGRLASDVVGKESIVSCAERFGFNQALFPTPALPSRSIVPQDNDQLKLMGAGLCKDVQISPLHAASMIAAIANGGLMMQPVLAREVRNANGEPLYVEKPQAVRRIVSPETARELSRMLGTTVSSGTSRRAFHDRRGRPKLASIPIAAKTGSINGTSPAGHYSWFVAYAPADNPQIALAALIVNQDKWHIKASNLGEQALEAFFR